MDQIIENNTVNNNLQELIENICENDKHELLLSALINQNSYDVFIKYKGDIATEKQKEFMKNIQILDIEELYNDEFEEEGFHGYNISILYKNEAFTVNVDEYYIINIY